MSECNDLCPAFTRGAEQGRSQPLSKTQPYPDPINCFQRGFNEGRDERVESAMEAATEVAVEDTGTRWVLCTTHSAIFPAGWEEGHKSGPLGERHAPGACKFENEEAS
jgi:hypothetical protein